MARPTCLYCGTPLQRPAAPVASAPPPEPRSDRVVLALDLQGADPGALAAALGLTVLEAELRVRRGLQLHKLLDPAEAEAEAAALAEAAA